MAEVVPDDWLNTLISTCELLNLEANALLLEDVRTYLQEKTAYVIQHCFWLNGRLTVKINY